MGKGNNDGCDVMTHSQKGAYNNVTGQGTLHIAILSTQRSASSPSTYILKISLHGFLPIRGIAEFAPWPPIFVGSISRISCNLTGFRRAEIFTDPEF